MATASAGRRVEICLRISFWGIEMQINMLDSELRRNTPEAGIAQG